jgi:excisionase family DNA binding protein
MEKISIVKRRRRGPLEPDKEIFGTEGQSIQELTEIPARLLKQEAGGVAEGISVVPEFPSDTESVSIKLTPEQYNFVKSSQYVNYFLEGDSSGVSMDMQQRPDGQIVFNFQFKKVDTVKMLKSKHVCQMLQISESLLLSLVKLRKIRSYKIGRLRRFLLEDILDYLSKSEDITNSKA